jgi:ABC-type Fe3+-hydroxamate transport system substrate-binding protein
LRDPEIFLIPDFQGTRTMSMGDDATPEGKAEYLFATFPNASATKNRRVVVVPYQQVYTSLQNVDGVEDLARAFHPDAFLAGTPAAVAPKGGAG